MIGRLTIGPSTRENKMLKVWDRNTSSNVQKVMWAIGELGTA
jgi:hypothetical protein